MCLLSVPHLSVVPRDLGAVGLGGTPETWRTRAQCLNEANDGLPNQAQLSFQAQPLWFPIPRLPNVLYRHQYSLQYLPLHGSPSRPVLTLLLLSFILPPFSLLDDPLQVSARTAPPLWSCSRFPRRPSLCLVHPVPSIMASVQCTVCFCMPDSNYTMSNLRAVFILITSVASMIPGFLNVC